MFGIIICGNHPLLFVCATLVKFWETLRNCRKSSVRFLANLVYNDRRTLTGKTVTNIAKDCSLDRSRLCRANVQEIRYFPPLPGDEWKVILLRELLDIRDGRAAVPGIAMKRQSPWFLIYVAINILLWWQLFSSTPPSTIVALVCSRNVNVANKQINVGSVFVQLPIPAIQNLATNSWILCSEHDS